LEFCTKLTSPQPAITAAAAAAIDNNDDDDDDDDSEIDDDGDDGGMADVELVGGSVPHRETSPSGRFTPTKQHPHQTHNNIVSFCTSTSNEG